MTQEEKDKKNRAAGRIALLMSVGFIFDVGQAIIVYNSGKKAEAITAGLPFKWQMPKGRELMKTAAIVLVTSLITGLIVTGAEKMIFKDGEGKTPVKS
jgi:hypothetical protein